LKENWPQSIRVFAESKVENTHAPRGPTGGCAGAMDSRRPRENT